MPSILTATDLTVRYGARAILESATLGIQEGDRIGLVGRNGCGKTTFLRILAGLQAPDSGDVSRRRDLVASYLPQDFMLDAAKSVYENVRDGAQHVLNLIAEFESLPHDSQRHEELEHRIQALEGWTLDRRLETAMSHLNCPGGGRNIESLSGGEKRRVAMCRAMVSRPDFLMLDEPTNHLDPESIEWVAEFLENFGGTFLIVTHDRYFLDRVAKIILELHRLPARQGRAPGGRRGDRAQAADVPEEGTGLGAPGPARAAQQAEEPLRALLRDGRAGRAGD